MKDAQQLIEHILYLEGVPNLQRLGTIQVGENVPEDLNLDVALEQAAVTTYTEAIAHCAQGCTSTIPWTNQRVDNDRRPARDRGPPLALTTE